jgi:endonuclease/exonuclease/phosphatase family metal-dependent hydrolase
MFLGDFNLIRCPQNRNKPCGNLQLMLEFSDATKKLGIQSIPLKGQAFTWSNKQHRALLEKLDWCFITQHWSIQFFETKAKTLRRDITDHITILVSVKTKIPRPQMFRFENVWLHHDDFIVVVQDAWNQPSQ